ncbi:MAG: glycosyltransferase [Vicinamibacterales bacterium]
MRILWLKSDLLLPLDKGGKLRTWHLMKQLAARHEVTYLAFAAPDEPQAHIEGMHEVADRVEVVPRIEAPKGSLRFYARAARHLADPLPYAVGQYRSAAYRRRIEQLLATETFDLVVADFLCSAVNLPKRLPCPVVLFTHNVESEIWRRHAETAGSPLRRALYAAQYRRMLRYEAQALRDVDGILAVSDADRETFARLYDGVRAGDVHVVPTGVDTAYFAPEPAPAESRTLVFTGSMDWLPNEDAMVWFCRDVLPAIRAGVPDVRLDIVGRAPTPAVVRLAAEAGVVVTGRVEDVRPFIADAAVYVVPLRIGGGTRLKIFEAMAMGKPVVSTRVGAEGLPIEDGRHLVLADDPAAFAAAVVRLLGDAGERRRLGDTAHDLVARTFDWSAVADDLEAALGRLAASAAPSAWNRAGAPAFTGKPARPLPGPAPTEGA